ncbi:MAG: hypothetical protein CVV06_14765 [Gammaproteobacteria bacterium HGW-Gammaproteobacteria-10]|nr:MAG: hypothetical protein CVV06_14765 [Gammaproteobacteria bacterium HGW-Gammaproteobacteria-10]
MKVSLTRQLASVLAIKFLLLWGLWFAFFRHEPRPPDRSDLAARLYGAHPSSDFSSSAGEK